MRGGPLAQASLTTFPRHALAVHRCPKSASRTYDNDYAPADRDRIVLDLRTVPEDADAQLTTLLQSLG